MTSAPREPFFPADKSIRASEAPLDVRYLGLVDYQQAWDLQADLAGKRGRDQIGDTVLVLEHPYTYTAGKRTQPADMPDDDSPVVVVDRGGRITWHGEGQLVVYPIVKLAEPVDVVDYVRRLEEAIIATVRAAGISTAGRIAGRSGVWVPAATKAKDPAASHRDRKIAALGIRITRGVTMHGLSLNCNNSLAAYEHIIACGIDDADVTTMSMELGRNVDPGDVDKQLVDALIRALAGDLSVANHTFGSAPNPSKGVRGRDTIRP
ncbi:lipoyl(octanoyl) transferase LipB [Corynebacterium mayonis]|uniref:lipoyl(octanoyl) transferase LipB n=1 Tax=Corynebacterium mayonis TaxID=3062461 RepID=UPI0031409093